MMETPREQFLAQARETYTAMAQERQEEDAAQKRSWRLLQAHLSPEEIRALTPAGNKRITVKGSHGGTYAIHVYFCNCGCRGGCVNTQVYQSSDRGSNSVYWSPLCISAHPPDSSAPYGTFPWPDQVLALKLALETNEQGFLGVANYSGAIG